MRKSVNRQRRRRYKKHRTRILAAQKTRYHANLQWERDRAYTYRLRNKFGMTFEQYKTMQHKQNGRCAICGNEPTSRARLVVDHDHQTGEIRGLLCHRCNRLIAWADERKDVLVNAASYLSVVRGEKELTSRPPRQRS